MTPRGSYRTSLERHLTETQSHEKAVARRIREIGRARGVVDFAYGVVTTAVGQALVLTKGPLDLLRGGPRGEEKLLKNARDEVVTEALEIADLRRHRGAGEGGRRRAHRAARRAPPRRRGEDAGRAARAHPAARRGGRARPRPAARRATTGRRPAPPRPSSARPRPPAARGSRRRRRRPRDYDKLTASDVVGKLTDFTQAQLGDVVAYERANRKRATVIDRAQSLQEDEPFSGYDDLTARDVAQRLTRRRRAHRPPGPRVRGAPPPPRRGPRGRAAPAQRGVVMTRRARGPHPARDPDHAGRAGRAGPAGRPGARAGRARHAGRPRAARARRSAAPGPGRADRPGP